MDMLDSELVINNVENSYRFIDQEKEIWINTQPVWLITVKERLLEFYPDYTNQFNNMLWHWM